MDNLHSPEELAEMEGNISDLKKVESEGFQGHAKGGADVKFVSSEEQKKRKEAEITEIDKNFAEYVRSRLELIADRQKLYNIWLGNIQTHTYPERYLQNNVARSIIHNNPGKSQAVYEKTGNNNFLVGYVDPEGNLYKVNIDFSQIPGAEESIKKLGHPITFLQEQFQKMGCAYEQIGLVSSFSGHERVGLEKMFQDLSEV